MYKLKRVRQVDTSQTLTVPRRKICEPFHDSSALPQHPKKKGYPIYEHVKIRVNTHDSDARAMIKTYGSGEREISTERNC